MPATPFANLRYPIGSDAPNVPQFIQQLATDVDNALKPAPFALQGTAGFNLTSSTAASIDSSGRRHLDGWVRNAATMTPQAGEAIMIIPVFMRPASTKFFAIPVNVGHTVIHVDVNPDGWVRVARTYPNTIPANAAWSFDGVSYP